MRNKLLIELRSIAITVVGSVILMSLINTKVFAMAKVQGSSMENTLYNNEKLIINKMSHSLKNLKKGDIIIFFDDEEKGNVFNESIGYLKEISSLSYNTDDRKRLVKRVIGVPGDEIDIKDGYVYLNGEKLEEHYSKGETYTYKITFPIKVEEDTLFVLGDNREVSKDGRDFGLINIDQIEGKVTFRVAPLNKFGLIK